MKASVFALLLVSLAVVSCTRVLYGNSLGYRGAGYGYQPSYYRPSSVGYYQQPYVSSLIAPAAVGLGSNIGFSAGRIGGVPYYGVNGGLGYGGLGYGGLGYGGLGYGGLGALYG